jgi:methylenetetrahydrofolate reductase (NADPH)
MPSLPFRADEKLTEVLRKQKFTLSAEVIPPRNGAEQGKVLEQIQTLIQSGAQFLAVTKGAGGSLRGGSLPIAQAIKEQFKVPCIAHFTCRDLSPEEVENHLMDHHYFGIRNILALRGDPPDGQTNWTAKPGGYSFAYQLIEQIKNLNSGTYLKRTGGPEHAATEKTDFCIGAAAYPEHPNENERLEFFKIKITKGAEYGITDMVFDPDVYGRFLDLCSKNKIKVPILPGTRLLKSKAQADRMAKKFKVTVPKSIYDQLPSEDDPDALKKSVALFLKSVDRMKSLGAPGIHIYVIADTNGAASALKELRKA